MTKMMSRALTGVSALAFSVLAASPAAAQNIDRIVAFGDSIADSGNAIQLLLASPAVPPATKAQLQALYPTGRFSGGTNYIDTLSQILGAPSLNYAVGGAQTGAFNQFAGLPGFTQETAIFLSGTTPPGTIFPANTGFQEGDLLALSIGTNDGRAFYQTNPAGTIAQAQAAAAISVASATTNLDLLVGAGAPTISYLALNAGLTPDVLANPTAQALGNAFSTTFNTGFQTTLAGYAANGVMVHYLDGATVLANVAANPGAYGISNLYCPAAPDPTCIVSSAGYLFYADGIHPTSDGMRILAQYVAAQLTAPLTLQAPSDVALTTGHQFARTLDGRMNIARVGADAEVSGLKAFIVGDMLTRSIDAGDRNDAFKISGHGLTAGIEYGFGGGVVGLAANVSRPKAKFGNDAARDKAKSVQIGGYAAMNFGGALAQGYVGYGKYDLYILRLGVVDALSAD
jgi:phospholipase/lecithinase/hemolysin